MVAFVNIPLWQMVLLVSTPIIGVIIVIVIMKIINKENKEKFKNG